MKNNVVRFNGPPQYNNTMQKSKPEANNPSYGSYLIVKYVTLPHRQPLRRILQKIRYTIINCTIGVFLIDLSYTWTTEE